MTNQKKLIITIIIIVITTAGLLLLYHNFLIGEEQNKLKGKVGYINIQTIFDNHPGKKKAEDTLNKTARDMQLELENKLEDVSKEEHQQLINDYQNKLSKKENELISAIITDIEKTVSELAVEKEMRIVVKGQDVIDGGYDITQLVLQEIRKSKN